VTGPPAIGARALRLRGGPMVDRGATVRLWGARMRLGGATVSLRGACMRLGWRSDGPPRSNDGPRRTMREPRWRIDGPSRSIDGPHRGMHAPRWRSARPRRDTHAPRWRTDAPPTSSAGPRRSIDAPRREQACAGDVPRGSSAGAIRLQEASRTRSAMPLATALVTRAAPWFARGWPHGSRSDGTSLPGTAIHRTSGASP
jgi:hypothetical protein